MTVISVIIGITRQDRFSEKPAQWVFQQLKKRDDLEARLLDLRDYPMPSFDQGATPATPLWWTTTLKTALKPNTVHEKEMINEKNESCSSK